MRLTLRTLLAYLDDTLEPAQAKLIGQKVAESDTAQELIARIKQVTHRRRLTTPPDKGPTGKVDPNSIAEYLDNTLTADQLAEVEQLCLSSDVHLAEIAACHQILTLVLGEPALVPPTAKQRMYGLVKGRESLQFRKPPASEPAELEAPVLENRDVDETLRLGLPVPVKGKVGNRLILAGGGLLLMLFLGIALWQLLSATNLPNLEQADQPRAQADGNRPLPGAKGDKDDHATDQGAKAKQKKEQADSKGKLPDTKKKVEPEKKQEKEKIPPPEADPDSANWAVGLAGLYETKHPMGSVLLQLLPKDSKTDPENKIWQRLESGAKVWTGTPLVSLPGYRSAVQVGGVQLVLWGNFMTMFWKDDLAYQLDYDRSVQQRRELDPKAAPPPFPFPPLLDASVVLHANKKFDLDLTLKRGRILLANTNKGKQPVKIRLRFDNPTNPGLQNIWDMELPYQGCELAVERWSYFPFTEPFFEDRHSPRPGPIATVELFCLKGEARIEIDGKTLTVDEPVGFSRLVWISRRGKVARLAMEKLPEWYNVVPPATPRMGEKELENLSQVTQSLARDLKGGNVDVVLKNAVNVNNPLKCGLAMRSLAALDDEACLNRLIDALEDADNGPARLFAIDSLRYWIALERDNDYRLYDLLAERYRRPKEKKSGEAAIIMGLLHDYPEKARYDKNVYGALIHYLGSNRLAIRELAYWRLHEYYPEGEKLQYSPIAAPNQRQMAIDRWLALLQANQLPPLPMPKKK